MANLLAAQGGRPLRDGLADLATWLGVTLVAGSALWVVADVIWHGVGAVNWGFVTTAPQDAGRAGGISTILVATFLVLLVCMTAALPLGLGAAMYLSEYGRGPMGRWVRRSLDVLAGVPSIVFGLFGAVFFVQVLGLGFSILAGGLTLACMVLPILIRTTEMAFSGLPQEYRAGAAALGFGPSGILLRVLLPAAAPGLVAGLILGVGRALAETAVLIFTSGYVDRMPDSLLDSGRVLSLHIFDLSMNVPGGDHNAYGAAVVLLLILLVINGIGGWLSRRWIGRGIVAS